MRSPEPSPAAGGRPVVEAAGVTKWYGETTALDRVDLVIDAGTVHGLLGPNGAGKTTLLSALFGLVLPDEGELRLFGRTRATAGAAWLDGVGGFVEAPRFYPYLSGRANLEVLSALDGGDAPSLVDHLVDLVGLGSDGDRKVRGYSLGMRQRLGLAAALLRRPRLLILDEPTNGMDPAGIRDLTAALRRLAEDGVTVILSSHDMHQVEAVCDAVTVLHRGTTVWSGSLDAMRGEAPDPVWQLRTSDDAAALAVAGRRAGVDALRHDQDGPLAVMAGQAALDDLVVELGRAGVAVRALVLDTTPLQSFFFHLTEGRGADPGAAPAAATGTGLGPRRRAVPSR
ncbi:ABC transporter ATP-binding protein [Acidiferrimicrobium sp. IK]|uniref:ABC transporter ATP-binding protein n=1 Tax=Acidiferrimicrobium sp. IK TaxID=2871700 RepID=UPI0021CB616E|nr:ABC transporter ATP-binding protein [Acidiferrimicrobium sp. IK]MCU4185291.1 ABC transporter ATP-binding protein [Acidiferrimicrobium sp. IK]